MPLSALRLDAITEAHLQGLVDDGVREGRSIEFKKSVGSRDEDKREFLADVSSFANAAGGDLLVGVTASGGVATALPGIPRTKADAEVLRLDSVVRDGIDPRIPGFTIQPVDL